MLTTLLLSTALLHPAAGLQQPVDDVVAAGAPGAAALVQHDRRTTTAAAGNVRAGDRFRIGSTTKTFVATVVLQLAAEHRLRLSDTVERWAPGALPYGDDVTIHQLLNHTGGVPDFIGQVIPEIFGGDRFRTWTPDELLAIARAQPRTKAGQWAYSNTDYLLLGLIVERATGHTLRHELRQRILRPLRLRDTSFPERSSGIRGRHAHGFTLGDDGRMHDITRFDPSPLWASGNGVSTVRDLARFQRALLGGRLLRPAQLAAMTSGVETGQSGRRYGLGVFIRDTRCGTLVGNDGDSPGFSNSVMSTFDGTRTAVVMVNAKFAPDAVGDAFDRAVDVAACE